MNDDALLPDHELASAYLDGDLSEAERAQVQSTPHLAALVATFTQVRAEIADVSAPDSEARESALAASLSQFETLFGATSTSSAEEHSANVVPLAARLTGRQIWRRRWVRPLLVAAASVILLGVAGVTMLNSSGDNDDQSATVQTESKDLAASGEAESAPADVSLSTIGAINGPASTVTQILDSAQLLEFAYQYAPVAADEGGAGTDTSPAAAEATAAEATETRTSACPLGENQVIIADIIWIDTLAVAVRDMVTGEVQAIDAQCRVLVSVTP